MKHKSLPYKKSKYAWSCPIEKKPQNIRDFKSFYMGTDTKKTFVTILNLNISVSYAELRFNDAAYSRTTVVKYLVIALHHIWKNH